MNVNLHTAWLSFALITIFIISFTQLSNVLFTCSMTREHILSMHFILLASWGMGTGPEIELVRTHFVYFVHYIYRTYSCAVISGKLVMAPAWYTWVRIPPEAVFSLKNTCLGRAVLCCFVFLLCCVTLSFFLSISLMIEVMYINREVYIIHVQFLIKILKAVGTTVTKPTTNKCRTRQGVVACNNNDIHNVGSGYDCYPCLAGYILQDIVNVYSSRRSRNFNLKKNALCV